MAITILLFIREREREPTGQRTISRSCQIGTSDFCFSRHRVPSFISGTKSETFSKKKDKKGRFSVDDDSTKNYSCSPFILFESSKPDLESKWKKSALRNLFPKMN